uniref:Ig-like domain-containing protein n=1 Tax=Strigamia maritima TaxID=126957 RepID=T1IWA1_STRMM
MLSLILFLTIPLGVTCSVPIWNTSCPVPCNCSISFDQNLKKQLQTADCSHHNISSVPLVPQDTESLLLRNNRISDLSDVIPSLLQLRQLDVSVNKLAYLGRGHIFKNLTLLFSLNLSKNKLSAIYKDVFRRLIRMEHLSVADNFISFIESSAFKSMGKLKVLDLSSNQLNAIYVEFFSSMSQLTELNVANNRIHRVTGALLTPLKKLEKLHLQQNRIADISDDAFLGLTRLQILNLANNLLHTIPSQSLRFLNGLHTLDLSSNQFDRIKSEDLCDLNVEELNLNQLHRMIFVDENGICNLTNLVTLQMHNNENLMFMHPKSINNVPKLKDIYLHNNNLQDCEPTALSPHNGTVDRKLGERFSFDCRGIGIPIPSLSWILPSGQWLNRSSNSIRYQLKPEGTLTFLHLKEEDAGVYSCAAINPLGRSRISVGLRVLRVDINLFPIGVASTFVALVWNGTARSALPNYTLMYKAEQEDKDSIRYLNVSPLPKSYTIRDLLPETTYEFCIAFKDPDGFYVRLSCTSVRTQDAEYMTQGIQRTSNVAVAIVLGIIAAMLMVICMVTTAARSYRHGDYENADKPPLVNSMSQIPLDNLYSPLMSNIGS